MEFEDEMLRRIIARLLGKNDSDEITNLEMEEIEILNISSVTSLKGIEHAINLKQTRITGTSNR